MSTQRTFDVIAECDRCGGSWRLLSGTPHSHLEGACMTCQADSDTEKPLTFRPARGTEGILHPGLPLHWLNI